MNGPFVLWACAHSTLLLCLLSAVDAYSTHPPTSRICSVLSSNMMGCFLLANVLTGALNLSIRTLDWSDTAATVLLTVYMSIVTGGSLLLDSAGFKLKL
jgi:glucosaminylphosphatidylinositol acyltransferase